MSWAFLERRFAPFLLPQWLVALQVRKQRRRPAGSSRAHSGERQLFIDVGAISRNDAGTGIQRLVRAVASQLLARPPAGWQVVPVGAIRRQGYCRISWPASVGRVDPGPLQVRAGDVFLGLDFSLDDVYLQRRQLAGFKQRGAAVWFLMYDLLPLQRPDWFSDRMVVRYRRWIRVLAALADGFYCISPPVEEDLRQELRRQFGIRGGYRTRVLPMGWDLHEARHSVGLPGGFGALQASLETGPTVLMVGTLEPRKGHADVLEAFECLWSRGLEVNFVIVGRAGWKNDALIARLRSHPRRGTSLFWLEGASDEALTHLYRTCDGVIVASHAEGFGLPLVEALGHGKSVLARDLEVFRLHAHHGVRYFPANAGAQELSHCIWTWISAPLSPVAEDCMPSWRDTAECILSSLA